MESEIKLFFILLYTLCRKLVLHWEWQSLQKNVFMLDDSKRFRNYLHLIFNFKKALNWLHMSVESDSIPDRNPTVFNGLTFTFKAKHFSLHCWLAGWLACLLASFLPSLSLCFQFACKTVPLFNTAKCYTPQQLYKISNWNLFVINIVSLTKRNVTHPVCLAPLLPG